MSSEVEELHKAAAKGDLARLDQILEAKPELLDSRGKDGMTLLHQAAYGGHLKTVRYLVDRGMDVQIEKDNGSVPLHGAALYGHVKACCLLLELGADVNFSNQFQYTPFHSAVTGGNEKIVDLFLEQGADVNLMVYTGALPLHIAVGEKKCNENVVRMLLDAGAEPDGTKECERTPLFDAAHAGHMNAVKLLVDRGADVNAKCFKDLVPLGAAVRGGNADVVAFLLENGAEVNVRRDNGDTPLQSAVVDGNAKVVKQLVKYGAPLNVQEEHYGRTPLHWAAIKGNRPMVELLLKLGARADLVDNAGRNVMECAAQYAHGDVVEILASGSGAGCVGKGALCDKCSSTPGGACCADSSPLVQALNEGEAMLWYLGHCGWGIRTQNHFLIFDCWNRGHVPANPCLANGHVNPRELQGRDVTVFVTHEHGDHFDPAIFEWADAVDDITYVFGFNPVKMKGDVKGKGGYDGPAYKYVGPREHAKMKGMEIRTLQANDAGVGFLVHVDGLALYHAGDHAGWQDGEKEGFTREIDYIADFVDNLDLAFLNVTGCHARGEDRLREGTLYTLGKLNPCVMIPTHALDREYQYRQAGIDAKKLGLSQKLYCPEARGDFFFYKQLAIE
jgi:ankyrin repeat protein/L-ascorbate metabolism protein UlaG (beta-lactamase superfamily)